MTSPWISLLPKLPLFAPPCTGIANQMSICHVARPRTHLSLLQIASLTSWFHQGVLFSLSPATLSRFCPQLSAADEMIADLNSSHFFSMSSDTLGSFLNLDDVLDANCFLTSLSTNEILSNGRFGREFHVTIKHNCIATEIKYAKNPNFWLVLFLTPSF